MEIKIKKDNGFVRLRITDDAGKFVAYIHIDNLLEETLVFIPKAAEKNFSIHDLQNEIKPQQ